MILAGGRALNGRGGGPATGPDAAQWERLWAPYDESTYQAVLDAIGPDDVVLDIGAGDLRLATRMAARARRVYAIEIDPERIPSERARPGNLHVVCADAYDWPFPAGLTVAVLLMRHCLRVGFLIEKLTAVGCHRLITNARWGLGPEELDLWAPREPYSALKMGWYACLCGATGFVPGLPQALTPVLEAKLHEVHSCPKCN
jgi:SAM-dependent methyltransferase